jgi:tetratricopeptide (TPR) repeat protein
MAKSNEVEMLLKGISEAMDHTPPAVWRSLVERALTEDVQAAIWGDQPILEHPDLQSFRQDYLEWKQLMAAVVIPDGSAFQRDFWHELVSFSGSVPYIDQYAVECAKRLMHEVMGLFIKRELSEAEKLNDAGFDRHHSGGYEEAIRLHDQALALAPDFALAWVNKGIALKNLGRFDEAVKYYNWVIEHLDPEYKKAWHNKAVVLMMQGEFQKAVKCLDHALEIDPQYEIAHQVREKCVTQMQAEKLGGASIRLPQHPQALQFETMAARLGSSGNWTAAARLYEQALSYDPGNPSLLVSLGHALFECGRQGEAEASFREAVAQDQAFGLAWLNLARCLLQRQDFQGGLEAADRATQYSPDHAMAWANRAAALFALKRYEEAEESAHRSVELDNRNEIGLYYLGACHYYLGRFEEACEPLKRFVKAFPDSPGAQSARNILSYLDRK